jgi:hypothetical protein
MLAARIAQVFTRLLDLLLARPPLLIAGAVVFVALLLGLNWVTSASVATESMSSKPARPSPSTSGSAAGGEPGDADAAVVQVVAQYNQASIAAGLLIRADVVAPFLAPDGTAWQQVQAEFQRRAAHNETHDAALERWGIVRTATHGDTATVTTQEEWSQVVSVSGHVTRSTRGMLARITYTLRRSPAAPLGWLITDVAHTTFVQ